MWLYNTINFVVIFKIYENKKKYYKDMKKIIC